jgi:hypothetical protein
MAKKKGDSWLKSQVELRVLRSGMLAGVRKVIVKMKRRKAKNMRTRRGRVNEVENWEGRVMRGVYGALEA